MITYIARNTLNGKFYIGSTTDFARRKQEHLTCSNNYPFQNALKANPEIFEWEIFDDGSENRELEQALLDMWYGKEQCYNLNPNATEPFIYEWTEERRERQRQRARQRGTAHLHTPNAIRNRILSRRRNPSTGWDDDRKKKHSELMKGNNNKAGKSENDETRKRKSQARTGVSRPGHAKAMEGRTWWINEAGLRRFQRESPGPGWINSYGKKRRG